MKTKRLVAALSVAAGVAFLLTACGAPEEGIVHDKSYSAEYSYSTNDCVRYDTRRNADGTSGSSYCVQYQTNWHYVPASYSLDLYSKDGEKHGWKSVSREEYAQFAVGDWYGSKDHVKTSKGGGF